MKKTTLDTASLKAALAKRYTDLQKIGEGGSGIIYKATDKIKGKVVALKIIREEIRSHQEAVNRFIRVGQLVRNLRHPAIVNVYHIGIGDPLYIAMEFVEGATLAVHLKNKTLRLPEFQRIALEICSALEVAHDLGIVHGDIKLENIMMDQESKVKVSDFGSAGIVAARDPHSSLGTPTHMAPEQIKGQSTDARSDIYSLGISLYRMLTGNVPFPSGDIGYRQLHELAKEPSLLRPGLPGALDSIVMKCLEKKMDDRYRHAGELKEELLKLNF